MQMLFQHAVHLITVERVEFQTSPESFNFIFKNYTDDDTYELIYGALPHIMLYLSHVILGLFARIAEPEKGGKTAFYMQSTLGALLVDGGESAIEAVRILEPLTQVTCDNCGDPLKLTPHNAGRLVLTQKFRCTSCRRIQAFPFAWIF